MSINLQEGISVAADLVTVANTVYTLCQTDGKSDGAHAQTPLDELQRTFHGIQGLRVSIEPPGIVEIFKHTATIRDVHKVLKARLGYQGGGMAIRVCFGGEWFQADPNAKLYMLSSGCLLNIYPHGVGSYLLNPSQWKTPLYPLYAEGSSCKVQVIESMIETRGALDSRDVQDSPANCSRGADLPAPAAWWPFLWFQSDLCAKESDKTRDAYTQTHEALDSCGALLEPGPVRELEISERIQGINVFASGWNSNAGYLIHSIYRPRDTVGDVHKLKDLLGYKGKSAAVMMRSKARMEQINPGTELHMISSNASLRIYFKHSTEKYYDLYKSA